MNWTEPSPAGKAVPKRFSKPRVVGAVAVLLLACGGAPAGVGSSNVTSLIGEARERIEARDFDSALSLLELAAEVAVHEAPNYEPYLELAEVRCRMGDLAGGASLLEDVRCILDVDAGELPCYVGWDTPIAPGQANSELTPRCFSIMCGEAYLDYYSEPTEGQLSLIADFRKRVDHLDALCDDRVLTRGRGLGAMGTAER